MAIVKCFFMTLGLLVRCHGREFSIRSTRDFHRFVAHRLENIGLLPDQRPTSTDSAALLWQGLQRIPRSGAGNARGGEE